MRVMTLHEWFDDDVEYVEWVEWSGHWDKRKIGIKNSNEGALIINKQDVIALAKEFNLVVYEKDSNL